MRDEDEEKTEESKSQLHYWYGFTHVVPRAFSALEGQRVQKVALGSLHGAVITHDRRLYTFGSNRYGQLGDPTFLEACDQPNVVPALQDVAIIDVSCGAKHTAAVGFHGELYCWGDSLSGQCGLGRLGKFPEPQLVSVTERTHSCHHDATDDANASVFIQQVACGDRHTCALSDVGEIWVWGTGLALGLNTAEQALSPQKIEYLEGRRVLSIACGAQHSMALVQKLKRASLQRQSTQMSQGSLAAQVSVGADSMDDPVRSDSPVIGTTQQHRYRPSTCTKCKDEIYTFTETQDACIIDKHKCPLGLDVSETVQLSHLREKRKSWDGSQSLPSSITDRSTKSATPPRQRQTKSATHVASSSEYGRQVSHETDLHSSQSSEKKNSSEKHGSSTSEPQTSQQADVIEDRNVAKSEPGGDIDVSNHAKEIEEPKAQTTETNIAKSSQNEAVCDSTVTGVDESLVEHSQNSSDCESAKEKSGQTRDAHGNSAEQSERAKPEEEASHDGERHSKDAGSERNDSEICEGKDENDGVSAVLSVSNSETVQYDANTLRNKDSPSAADKRKGAANLRTIIESQLSSEAATELQAQGSPKDDVRLRHSSSFLNGGLPKSKSTFLDEAQLSHAKEFLDKALYGEEEAEAEVGARASSSAGAGVPGSFPIGSSDGSPPGSPFVKRVENILQYVPSPPAAMQEYVSNLTKNVVENIKTGIDRSFAFVTQNSADLDNISSSSQESVLIYERKATHEKGRSEEATVSLYGTMRKSTSMGAIMKAPSASDRKGSLPLTVLTSKREKVDRKKREVVLETEVWSWGKGKQCQLGHGDMLDRPSPCIVRSLTDKRVMKIVCGSFHSLALTASAQAYSWGLNANGQLGQSHNEPGVPTPQIIMPSSDAPAVDIAAGLAHSLVAFDSPGFAPDVYYAGRDASDLGQTEKEAEQTSALTRLSTVRKTGWLKQVVAGGKLSACITDYSPGDPASLTAALHELAATERRFHRQLDHLVNLIVHPMLASDGFKSVEGSMYGAVVKLMIDSLFQLRDTVSRNCVELSRVVRGFYDLEEAALVLEPAAAVAAFSRYSRRFGDVLSLGAFDHVGKHTSAMLDTLRPHLHELLADSRPDRGGAGAWGLTLRRLFQLPLHRLKDYVRILTKIAAKYPPYTSEHHQFSSGSQQWESLKQAASSEHTVAENTRKFWETCPNKFADALKTSGRRLIRESKTSPISMPSSGRFSMHWMILFNDVFVHGQYSMHQTFPLATIWVESMQDTDSLKNAMTLTMPEEVMTLTAPSASEKADWLWALNESIDTVLTEGKNLVRPHMGGRLTPPLARHAPHVFYKHAQLKDAKYIGMWLAGKMHGQGELHWPDGRKYAGKFKQGQQHGHGVLSVPKETGTEIYDGHWKEGKMFGLGTTRYANGDVYEGYFRESKKHGHGVLKQGRLTARGPGPLTSIYIGEWLNDKKNGYGVLDDISKGEKYMGMWQDDSRHGNGVIVSLDGMYFEGAFTMNKMTGFGLLMTDDNSCYEGEFSGGPNLHGKGTVTMPNGDYIEGHFSGSFSEGIKVNGMFHKASEPVHERKGFTHALGLVPKSFLQLSVPAERKWTDIFRHCDEWLAGGSGEGSATRGGGGGAAVVERGTAADRSARAWSVVAIAIANGKKSIRENRSPYKNRGRVEHLDELETIPRYRQGKLSLEDFRFIKQYLAKAFETVYHPLGRLMEGLVDVYRATYVGVGAHPRLLTHAVEEVKSFVHRVYPRVRLLFPDLPETEGPIIVVSEELSRNSDDESDSDTEDEFDVVTPGGLLHPLLLPKIYPPLFTLYALYNEKEDSNYWKRVNHWNKQSDMGLMSSLGIDQRFWLLDESMLTQKTQRLSNLKEVCYSEGIETLQHISTSFSPAEKLHLIQRTFDDINKAVQKAVGNQYVWCMDDLFPVFLYVVVRARIRHLGAEIHFIDDLMEEHLQHGELGIMFTTLKACYYQIQQEKLT